MNKQKIKTLFAIAIATSVITSVSLNTTIASATTKYLSENTENSYNGYGIANSVYGQLIEKGWKESSNGALTIHENMFKFRNLNGVNGKDASVVIKCADKEYDHYILELLDLMIGDDSSLTSKELALLIANGSGTIKDGSRFINIHYDGKIDYTITLTFYNYGYEPSYVLPSLDNYEMISTLENLINKNILSLTNIWGGTEKKPLETVVNSTDKSNIDDLFTSLKDISDNFNSAKIIENEDYSVLQISFNKENSFYYGKYFDYITVNFKINNGNSYAIESANKLVNEFNNVDTDDESSSDESQEGTIPEDEVSNDDTSVPPTIEEDNEVSNNDGTSTDDSQNDNDTVVDDESQNDEEIGTDNGANGDEVVSGEEDTNNEDSENGDSGFIEVPGDDLITPPVVNNGGETTDKPDNEVENGTDNSSDSELGEDTSSDEQDSKDDTIVEIDTVINNAISEGVISIKDNVNQEFSLVEIDINNVEISRVQSLFDSFATIANDVKITSNDEYTTITFKVKKSSNPFLRISDEYTEIILNIKNEYSDIVAIANDFAKDMSASDDSKEDTDIKDNNTNNTDDSSENINNSNDSKPNNSEQEYDLNNNSVDNNVTNVVDETTNSDSNNTVAVNSTFVNTNTEDNNSNEIKVLPKTGGVSSLPLLGMLSLSLGSILRRKRK